MSSTPSLAGQTVVVTGGTRGIGLAITTTFAEAGADVVPTSRTREDVETAAERVERAGGESLVVPTDVASDEDVSALFARVEEAFGGVDVVVNNAGINPRHALGKPDAVDAESFDHVVDVNLRGAYRCARAGAEALGRNGGGNVVNVASVAGVVGIPRQHPYVASKHGLVGLTKSLALDWAPDVRVNALAPGYVSTDLTAPIEENDDLYESVVEDLPFERFANPEEIAAPALFLASDMASYVTGETLVVDGGWTSR